MPALEIHHLSLRSGREMSIGIGIGLSLSRQIVRFTLSLPTSNFHPRAERMAQSFG